jgi:hypothetical protein
VSERIVLCEGYYDRAFWSGLLTRRGATSFEHLPPRERVDDDGRPITGGSYGFRSTSRALIRVQPCRGVTEVWTAARIRLEQVTKPLSHLVVNVDPDSQAGASGGVGRQRVEQLLQAAGLEWHDEDKQIIVDVSPLRFLWSAGRPTTLNAPGCLPARRWSDSFALRCARLTLVAARRSTHGWIHDLNRLSLVALRSSPGRRWPDGIPKMGATDSTRRSGKTRLWRRSWKPGF